MSLTMQQRRALLWMLGIIVAASLTSMAWHQINAALTRCFSFF